MNMLDVLNIILKWKTKILLFTLIAIAASVIITMPFIMPPYFKSKEVFYLSNPVSTDRAALFNEKEVNGAGMFGGKEDMNRFLSILNSDAVSINVIHKFGLTQHYKIKAATPELALYYTNKEFYNNFNAIRNDLGAIEVIVLDTDAKMACDMVKFIVASADSIYRQMLVDNKTTVLQLIDKQIAETEETLPGSVNYSDELSKLITIRNQYAVSSSPAFKTTYVVEEPSVAVKKTKPTRWLIVLATAIAAVAFASFVALIIEMYKNADKYGFKHS